MSELQTGDEFSDVVRVTDEMSPPHLPNKVLSTPDMVRLITKERKALDRNGRPRKVLTCEPRQHFKCAARNCTAFIEEVD